jgi:predicted nucleic acid-binding protein
LVVDASVAVKWFIEEDQHIAAREIASRPHYNQ